jgi:uncharacterized protein
MTDAEAAQAAVVGFLSDPATHGGDPVEVVETHISRLFLAGDRVLKLRRAVRTNFLDFTTLAARRADCEAEIAVNHAARGVYLGVIPVTRGPDGLALGGEGEAVDWVVAMRRFDRAQELDRLAGGGALTRPMIEALGDAVAAMHRAAPAAPGFGGAAGIAATIAQIAEGIGQGLPAADWAAEARAALAPLAARADARRRHGRVRRGHGDLHLGNIVLLEGVPTPFDALEFSEAMASTDLLYDLGFTVMDLIERGSPALAGVLVSRYLSACRDYSGLSLLALFVSMRAAVRALVAVARPPEGGEPGAAERLAFARAALAACPAPRLTCVGGLSGTGKSTLARAMAPALAPLWGAVMIRSDVARKRLFGVAPEAPLPDEAYQAGVGARVYTRVLRDAGRALRAGWPVILDATFLDAGERDRARALAARAGVPFRGLWLTAPEPVLLARLAGRTGDASDADAAVLRGQIARAPDGGDWTRVDAAGTPEETLRNALSAAGP